MEKLYRVSLVLDDAITADALIERMISASLLPIGTSAAYFRRFIALYRANAMAAALYRPPVDALPIPITVFRAKEHDAELGNGTSTDSSLGWSRFSSNVRVLETEGTHITMMTEPHVASLAAALRDILIDREALEVR
jgi:thioesterase domain-containing protein